jgi:hypothetical protein
MSAINPIHSDGADAIWLEANGTYSWIVAGNPNDERTQTAIELTEESSRAIRAALEAWEQGRSSGGGRGRRR